MRTQLWGRTLPNPVGLAAGFDKDGEAIEGLMGIGFGMVEIGSVTPKPQPGNARPRVFRLPEDRAVINRYGFNSVGHAAAAVHLAAFRAGRPLAATSTAAADQTQTHKLLGVNLGKNKTSASAEEDYRAGVRALGTYADYLVVNVSSPNTPGLRGLQERDALRALLRAVRAEARCLPGGARPPLVLKIAPDLSSSQRADVASVALSEGIDGIVVSNTTTARPSDLRGAAAAEPGGLSGAPLLDPSTECLAGMHLPCISAASPLHLRCISRASPLRLPCISAASPLHLRCISRASRPLDCVHRRALRADPGPGHPHRRRRRRLGRRRLQEDPGGRLRGAGASILRFYIVPRRALLLMRAGTFLLQLYSALVYDGPPLVPRLKRELAALLREDGYSSVAEAVGHPNPNPEP